MFVLKRYISPAGQDVMIKWLKTLGKASRVKFNSRMRHLAAQPRSGWRMKSAKNLEAGIWEIRFEADNTQLRPLGYCGPGPQDFTLLLGAIEKGGAFVPKDALKMAKKRKQEVEENGRLAHEWKLQ